MDGEQRCVEAGNTAEEAGVKAGSLIVPARYRFKNQEISILYITMETQREKVRRLSDSIIGFEPKSTYSHVKLRELAREMRTEDAETAMDVYKQVTRRVVFNSVTALGAYFAGFIVIGGPGIQYLTNGYNDLAGWACISVGVAVAFAGGRVRFEGLNMKKNLDMVTKEAQRQHNEIKGNGNHR